MKKIHQSQLVYNCYSLARLSYTRGVDKLFEKQETWTSVFCCANLVDEKIHLKFSFKSIVQFIKGLSISDTIIIYRKGN